MSSGQQAPTHISTHEVASNWLSSLFILVYPRLLTYEIAFNWPSSLFILVYPRLQVRHWHTQSSHQATFLGTVYFEKSCFRHRL